MRSRRLRRVVWAVRTWVARVEVVWRWGGSGEGVREGWVDAREVRRVGLVKMGSSCRELVWWSVSWAWGSGFGWGRRRGAGGEAYVLSRRTSGSQCSEGSGGGGFRGRSGIWDDVIVGESV